MKTNFKTVLQIIFVLIVIVFVPICPTKIAIAPVVKSYRVSPIAKFGSFLERGFTFRFLVRYITQDKVDAADKILAIYDWIRANIKDIPKGWGNKDDHELNIIMRGYATETDKVRVFCILTTFAGYPGQEYQADLFYNNSFRAVRAAGINFKGKWLYLDLINDVYFRLDGHIASIDEMKDNPERLIPNRNILIDPLIFYKSCKNLKEIKEIHYVRGHLQMLIPRIKSIIERVEVSNLY